MDASNLDPALLAAARALAKERATALPNLDRVWTLHRGVARKSLYDELRASDLPREIKDGLSAWVAVLTVARVTADAEEALATAATEVRVPLLVAPLRLVSWGEAWRSLVLAKDRGVAHAAFSSLSLLAPQLAPLARELRQARQEATGLLEGATALLGAEEEVPATRLARQMLEATADLGRDVLRRARKKDPEPWPLSLDVLLATDAADGWPRLSRRWLEDLFGGHARGLSLELRPLPIAAGGASFARALGSFGEAFRRAMAAPSAVAQPPRFVDAHRFAAAFGALAASPSFHRRRLGLSRRVADAQTRSVAGALLVSLRLECGAWLSGAGLLDLSELGMAAVGAELPKAFRGVWPAVREDGAARLVGWLSAERLLRWLVDRYDEDWFDNPRAWADLRGGGAPVVSVDADVALRVAKAFEDRLS